MLPNSGMRSRLSSRPGRAHLTRASRVHAAAAALFVVLRSLVGYSRTPPAAPVDAPSVPDEILVRFTGGMTAADVDDRRPQLAPPSHAGVLYPEPNYLLYSVVTDITELRAAVIAIE